MAKKTQKRPKRSATKRRSKNDQTHLRAALDGTTAALMTIDRDLVINFANRATWDLMRKYESEFRAVYPRFRLEELIGTRVDSFHENPEHLRRLLSDPANLPIRTDSRVGRLTFQINATAIIGDKGKYIGNTLEWDDVTELRDGQRAIERLIAAATEGHLRERIDVSHYEGFIKSVSSGINNLMDSIMAPISAASETVEALARGDLTQNMKGTFQGEFAQLQSRLNGSLNTLATMVTQISQAAHSINSAASDISEGNANLNTRTQEQSSSLEETASSLEELTATVKQNANNANQANQLAAGARDSAEKGGQVVGSAVSAMTAITEASSKVADIISVIEQIAFQTNMLALNAAVEAARAGDQGRGFAVVAAEVRTLAQRSASAAKEIKALIQDSQEKVSQGAKLVTRSGETLTEIVGSVKKVSDIIGEIDAASEQQASGIDQINSAIAQMDKNTQQNAAMVEQASAAAESMTEQARAMAELVRFFRTSEAQANEALSERRPAPSSGKRAGEAKAAAQDDRATDTHTGKQMFATRRPPPPSASDGDWKEF
jgi:methyl-accepting chemotaxis protein